MALETERKYLDVDFERLRSRLGEIGAEYEGARFETNILYDTDEKICERGNRVVRLRIVEKPRKTYNIFTIKWAVDNERETAAHCKIREELETEIGDAGIFGEMLAQMGYKAVLTYEKLRESWKVSRRIGEDWETVLVELDTLPFCRAVELEASCAAINHVSSLLDLDKFKISTTSYTKLYQEWLTNQGGHKKSGLLFSDPVREALRAAIGL